MKQFATGAFGTVIPWRGVLREGSAFVAWNYSSPIRTGSRSAKHEKSPAHLSWAGRTALPQRV